MSERMESTDEATLRTYTEFLDDHVIRTIRDKGISRSCFASYLLLCAALDGLGRLLLPEDHPNSEAKKRFNAGLDQMGGLYAARKGQLWVMRNALTHQAVSQGVFSRDPNARELHLREEAPLGGKPVAFVQTDVMLEDFARCLGEFDRQVREDPTRLREVARRLELWFAPRGTSTTSTTTTANVESTPTPGTVDARLIRGAEE